MSGLYEVERREFEAILNPIGQDETKLKDAWRHIHHDVEEYTYDPHLGCRISQVIDVLAIGIPAKNSAHGGWIPS